MTIKIILLFLLLPVVLFADEEPTAPVLGSEMHTAATVFVTPVFPGWGQLHSEGGWRATTAFGVGMYYWTRMLMYDRKAKRLQTYAKSLAPGDDNRLYYESQVTEYWELMLDFGWWGLGAVFIIAVDAYVGAHLYNFEEDPVPVPDSWEPGELLQPLEMSNSASLPGAVLAQWQFTF